MKKVLNQSGYSLVVMSIALAFILGLAALVIDVGMTIYEKQKLSNAIDAASLAAMQDIDKDDQTVINTARQYAQLNGQNPDDLDISINPDRKGILIHSTKDVKYFFARILGLTHNEVGVQTKAKVAPITAVSGVRPLTVANQELVYNQVYTLKDGAGDGLSGNYGALAFGGNGASVYRDNLLNGYQSSIKVGDIVFTETGNITQATIDGINSLMSKDAKSTFDNFNKNSPRLIVIPIVNTLDLSGKKPVIVVGFGAFYLEGISNNGGHAEVKGRFVKYITSGISSDSQTDYGLHGIMLTN